MRIPSGPEPVFLYDAYSYRERGLARVIVRDEANRRNIAASQGRRCRQARSVGVHSWGCQISWQGLSVKRDLYSTVTTQKYSWFAFFTWSERVSAAAPPQKTSCSSTTSRWTQSRFDYWVLEMVKIQYLGAIVVITNLWVVVGNLVMG